MTGTYTGKPPVPYFGGKQRIADQIIAHFPPHQHYVDAYAGGLSLLFAKPPSPMETVNDLDDEIVIFWRVLRDRPDDLARACWATPHSRTEHAAAVVRDGLDEMEVARRVWVRLTQGRAGKLTATGWRYHIDPNGSSVGMPGYLAGYCDRLLPAAARLRHVSIECMPALDLIDKYGQHEGVLIYADPPYLGSTRSSSTNGYRHEMKRAEDHAALLDALTACRAKVCLSGYRSPLYDNALAGWERVEIGAWTGQGSRWGARTEVLWMNYTPHPALFEVT